MAQYGRAVPVLGVEELVHENVDGNAERVDCKVTDVLGKDE
jgi:hypothetical protein